MKNLTEISSALAHMHPELTNKKALQICKEVVALITQGIAELPAGSRDRVSIAGFGNFGKKATNERTVKNIKTGELVTVPASFRITFKAADELRKNVASGDYKAAAVAEAEEEASVEQPAPKAPKAAKKAGNNVDVNNIPDLNDL